MLTAYSRVTIVTDDRTVDLALPSALPLADLLPQLLRYAAPDVDGHAPAAWTLGRTGGTSLGLAQTLADAGVVDGDVLELRASTQAGAPAVVEDVRDTIEDTVDSAGGTWDAVETGSFVVLAGSATVLLTLLGTWWLDALPSASDLLVAALGGVVALLAATAWCGRLGRARDARLVGAALLLSALVLGDALAATLELDAHADLVAVGLVTVGAAAAARGLSDAVTAHLAAATVGAVVLLVVGLVGLAGLDVEQAWRALPVLALLVVGPLPRVSLSVGGLAGADYRVRHAGRVSDAELRRRFRTSNDLLVGGLVGVASVVVVSGVLLDLDGDDWDRTLSLLLAITAAMRSRVFSRVQHMLALRLAAVVVLAAVVTQLAVQADRAAWLVPGLGLALVAGLGLATLRLSDIQRAQVKRTLNMVEFVVVVVLVVVLAGAMGVYDALGGIF